MKRKYFVIIPSKTRDTSPFIEQKVTRQNPRKKKQPLAEQERRRRQKNKKEEEVDRRTKKKKQSLTFQHSVHYLATHPPGIEEIRRLTFQHSGQTEIQQTATYLKCSIKIKYWPHSTLSAQAQIPEFQGQIQRIFTCHSHIPGQPALRFTF